MHIFLSFPWFILFGCVSRKYDGFASKGRTMIPLDIYKFKISKIANFDICRLIKQYTNFWCSNRYLRFYLSRWDWRDRATSIDLATIVPGLLVLTRRIGLSIKKISTDASSNSWRASEEGSHATLTHIRRFDVFEGRYEVLDDPGGLGGTFYNSKKGKVLRLTLEEMGWKKSPTTIFVDNNTASGICNSTIKRQRSRSMNGQYFWLIDQVSLNTYRIVWAPGLENLADYFTKHFAAACHHNVRPFYVHMQNSPRVIRKVDKKLSDKNVSARLRECVNIPTIPVAHTHALLVW